MILRDAIYRRTSQRNFKELPMSTKDLHTFTKGLKAIPPLYPDCDIAFEVLSYAEAEAEFTNLSKVCVYAPYYLLFYGDDKPEAWYNVGYFGQISALWLACNNYGACWQRADKLQSAVRDNVVGADNVADFNAAATLNDADPVKEGGGDELAETVPAKQAENKQEATGAEKTNAQVAVTEMLTSGENATSGVEEVVAEGTSAAAYDEIFSAKETLAYGSQNTPSSSLDEGKKGELETSSKIGKSRGKLLPFVLAFGSAAGSNDWKPAKKKALNKFIIGGAPEANSELALLLDAGIKAPSEYNRQPWRLWTDGKSVHIFVKPSFFFKAHIHEQADALAIGAFVANFATLAELKQKKFRLYDEEQAFREVKNLRYQLSLDLF